MKYKILTVLITIALSTTVLGQNQVVRPGITPRSPFYGLDRAYDRINYLIRAPNPPAQAKYGLKIARERVAEGKHMEKVCERMNRTVARERCHRRRRRCRRRARRMLNETKKIRRRRRRRGREWTGPRIPENVEEMEGKTELPIERCRGRPHPMCVGHWEIENERCKWVCE